MNQKLTLKLDKNTIERARKIAKKNKQSLSGMVENYFNMIAGNNTPDIEVSLNIRELSGIIKLKDNTNNKDTYHKHLDEKFSK